VLALYVASANWQILTQCAIFCKTSGILSSEITRIIRKHIVTEFSSWMINDPFMTFMTMPYKGRVKYAGFASTHWPITGSIFPSSFNFVLRTGINTV